MSEEESPAGESPDYGVPGGLSESAEDAFRDIYEENRDMSAGQYVALTQAAKLITLADQCESRIGDEYLVNGYRNQGMVASPLLVEARQARTSAAQILKQAGLVIVAGAGGDASSAGRSLVRQRWSRSAVRQARA